MKIVAMSDMHGVVMPKIEKCDVVCICGDIIPLDVQRDAMGSYKWMRDEFIPWCMDLPCERVILIAGNHDFYFQSGAIGYLIDDENVVDHGAKAFQRCLPLPGKIVYLQDSGYEYNGVTFYGTPWCPDLYRWAFYGNHDRLTEIFRKIPQDVDVLLTHTPGSMCNGTETSHFDNGETRSFGCSELTSAVFARNIRRWICGHIHTGNHEFSKLDNYAETLVANVSLIDESYMPAYTPTVFDI